MNKKLKTFLLTLLAMFGLPLTIFGFIFLATAKGADLPLSVMSRTDLPRLMIEKTILHTEAFGSPHLPPLFVLHDGPGGDYRNLLPLKSLSNQYRVIFYDQRGSGLSQRVNTSELTIEQYFKDLDALIAHYAPTGQISLLGHGWGGMMASAYTGKHPDRVKHLVLADPGFLNSLMAEKILGYMSHMSSRKMLLIAKSWIQSFHLSSAEPDMSGDFILGKVRDTPMYYCGDSIPENAWPYWRAGFGAWKQITQSTFNDKGRVSLDFSKGAYKYKNPVLFLTGECNTLTGPKFQKEQIKLFAHPELKVLKNTGHMMFTENPKSVEWVRAFLNKDS